MSEYFFFFPAILMMVNVPADAASAFIPLVTGLRETNTPNPSDEAFSRLATAASARTSSALSSTLHRHRRILCCFSIRLEPDAPVDAFVAPSSSFGMPSMVDTAQISNAFLSCSAIILAPASVVGSPSI